MKTITKIFLVLLLLVEAGCATSSNNNFKDANFNNNGEYALSEEHKKAIVDELTVYDPFEPVNRRIYKFNYYFDTYLLLPVVIGYQKITPKPVQKGVDNFFANLGDISNFINNTLQLKGKESASSLGRLGINTTIGILGIFDVASKMGINKYKEDFGQTLAYYGVGDGPFLVIPFLGPSNLRDITGLGVDYYTVYDAIDPLDFEDHKAREYLFLVVGTVNVRKKVPVAYFESGSPFEYELLRRFYTDARKLEAGSVKTRFGKDESMK